MIYDITFPLFDETPIYEGDPSLSITVCYSIAKGDPANVTQICMGVHTATHVDAPSHFIEGARKVHELEIEKLIGPCRVVEIDESVTAIAPEHLNNIEGIQRILFKTRNSSFWNDTSSGFRYDFTYITPEAAEMLVEHQIKLVGIDYLSVEKFGSEDFSTHIMLLSKEVIILEGLDLRAVPPGDYELICLPMKIMSQTGDGAPARAILRL
jgi:arylformamidase